MAEPTHVQAEVLRIIGRWFNKNRPNMKGPSLREIAKERDCFHRAVVVALGRLERDGYIKRRRGGVGMEVLLPGKAWLEENLLPDD